MPSDPLDAVRALIEALDKADWQQVAFNGGPPCFHIKDDGAFCLCAKRWAGHDHYHPFVESPVPAARAAVELLERERAQYHYKGPPLTEQEMDRIMARLTSDPDFQLRSRALKAATLAGDREGTRAISELWARGRREARHAALEEAADCCGAWAEENESRIRKNALYDAEKGIRALAESDSVTEEKSS